MSLNALLHYMEVKMCDNCKKLIEQIAKQQSVLQQLIQGMEIMTTNARVLTRMCQPESAPKDAA